MADETVNCQVVYCPLGEHFSQPWESAEEIVQERRRVLGTRQGTPIAGASLRCPVPRHTASHVAGKLHRSMSSEPGTPRQAGSCFDRICVEEEPQVQPAKTQHSGVEFAAYECPTAQRPRCLAARLPRCPAPSLTGLKGSMGHRSHSDTILAGSCLEPDLPWTAAFECLEDDECIILGTKWNSPS